jgi:hypothetical protein
LYSLYDPLDTDPIFQIDANLGYPAAVMVGSLALRKGRERC